MAFVNNFQNKNYPKLSQIYRYLKAIQKQAANSLLFIYVGIVQPKIAVDQWRPKGSAQGRAIFFFLRPFFVLPEKGWGPNIKLNFIHLAGILKDQQL